jgi:hypothetical protein
MFAGAGEVFVMMFFDFAIEGKKSLPMILLSSNQ